MYGYRDVVAESKVIQKINGEKHEDVRQPSNQRNSSSLGEERRMRSGEMCRPSKEGGKDELEKCNEETLESSISCSGVTSERNLAYHSLVLL